MVGVIIFLLFTAFVSSLLADLLSPKDKGRFLYSYLWAAIFISAVVSYFVY